MARSASPQPTFERTVRVVLATAAEQARDVSVRLQGEYERSVGDPDVIQEDRSSAQVLADQARTVLARANNALARFDRGSYGICTECGAEISGDRLEAVPETETCRNCS